MVGDVGNKDGGLGFDASRGWTAGVWAAGPLGGARSIMGEVRLIRSRTSYWNDLAVDSMTRVQV